MRRGISNNHSLWIDETLMPCSRIDEIKGSTSFCNNAILPRHNAFPFLIFNDSNEKDDVTINLLDKMVALIRLREIVATHFPPANPCCPPNIFANWRQSDFSFCTKRITSCSQLACISVSCPFIVSHMRKPIPCLAMAGLLYSPKKKLAVTPIIDPYEDPKPVVAVNKIYHGREFPSHVKLPILYGI